jgi:hypothetical protein
MRYSPLLSVTAAVSPFDQHGARGFDAHARQNGAGRIFDGSSDCPWANAAAGARTVDANTTASSRERASSSSHHLQKNRNNAETAAGTGNM